MKWSAVIPLKGSGERKTRLAHRFTAEERRALSDAMFAHVAQVLRACPEIADVAVLSDIRPAGWEGTFFVDAGRGLNAEMEAVAERARSQPFLVIHADLPLVTTADIADLLARAAEAGIALAPDQHGTGTNAIALTAAGKFPFAFGENSYTRHLAATDGKANVVTRTGLAVDIDTSEDYDVAVSLGYCAN